MRGSVRLLLSLWQSDDVQVRREALNALRSKNGQLVFACLQPELAQGRLAVLDAMPVGAAQLPALLAYWKFDDANWEGFLERLSGATLHTPELRKLLLSGVERGHPLSRAGWMLTLKQTQWSDEREVRQLGLALEPALASEQRLEILKSCVDAIAPLRANQRARLLASIAKPSDTAVIECLVDTVLEDLSSAELLPAPLRAAVEREMSRLMQGEPERARRILSYRVTCAQSASQLEQLLNQLEQSMSHAAPRVRRHAHRLLRRVAPRERYLAATRTLLDERDPATLRSAIRTLAFARDVDSVQGIANLLTHAQPLVRTSAQDALVLLGDAAAPLLRKTMANVRPDKQSAYALVLQRIEQAKSGAGDAELGNQS